MRKNLFQRIYKVVKKIPKGKVVTYGQIARFLGINPRTVGWALHAKCDRVVPCHRVVDRNGRLAKGYAFGGPKEQKRKLLAERVEFRDEKHVALEKHLWRTF